MTTFRQLLDQFEESASTRAAKGRVFERFCEAFFRVDPLWSERFEAVWSWADWPGRGSRGDTGIDLVARERGTGDLVAIQCKFYSPDATLSWSHVSTFSGMLGQPDFASGLIVSTAGAESANVHRNLDLLGKPITVWRVDDFEESRVDWDQFRIDRPTALSLRERKEPFAHQVSAIEDVRKGFAAHDRGQLIMACGTGKTFTSLRLAEEMVGVGGSVLFLVPSINLLSQSVLAWAHDAAVPLSTFAVCSDTKAGQRGRDEDMSANDLAFPASTDAAALAAELEARAEPGRMTAVFSTYQSIDVITEVQEQGFRAFDLIICDEAHRTTGTFRGEADQSAFTKVHEDRNVQGHKRLYMTATPRIYGDQAKAKGKEQDILIASMDDESCYGPEFHNLGFGEAVARNLLTDYKVLVLAVNEEMVADAFQQQFTDAGKELPLNDMARLVGCWHGLSKRGPQFEHDNIPMQRAVAFSSTIAQSKAFTEFFPELVNTALENRRESNAVKIEAQHVDGKTNVKVRSEAIAWLEEPPGQRVCRVLSNAKCLTEGVDVPALDAVMFLNPRRSIVDVVQAVGRVMRRSPDKEFGYVILPIGIPAGVTPEEALRDHKSYEVVWQVLQALRSHDERLAAEINKIDINGTSSKVNVIGVGMDGGSEPADPDATVPNEPVQGTLDLPDLREWVDALYARIVEKVGDRRYMEHWAEDISAIARAQETRIRALLDHPDQNPQAVERFDRFHTALRESLNDGVSRDDAIGMLSQHLITRPVFEALFEGDGFTRNNPVSVVMQDMIDTLDDANLHTETKVLEGFYEHIRMLIGGINTAEGRQRVITELYEKFFKKALPKTAESLGIVYTPIEIVDFINRSVDELLQKHFDGTRITDEGVHVLDPFTGTGTFITRLLQSGLIEPEDLERKYRHELHANEVMLLAYYIAAINIETVYDGLTSHNGTGADYQPFDGIVLTDTFALADDGSLDRHFFPQNNARADHQRDLDIRVILGNPPYSVGQTSQNDDNQNLKYPAIDGSIATTYAARSTATNKNSLYDSYVRAFRWASDRLAATPEGGIIGFVSNGGWLDGNTADGIRYAFANEFHHVYVYNLRGNQRTSGELSRKEGGKVFDSGSRNTVAITFLIRKPEPVPSTGAEIHYRDIGDYLTREDKLAIVDDATIATVDWETIVPNSQADWINQRDNRYDQLVPLSGKDGIFELRSNGLQTNRDAWVYNSSTSALRRNVESMIAVYNTQLEEFKKNVPPARTRKEGGDLARNFVDRDPKAFSWDREDFRRMASGITYELADEMVRTSLYRPFTKQHVAFDRMLNKETSQLPKIYPHGETNIGFSVQSSGPAPFFALATDEIPDLVICGAGNASAHFARWRYEEPENGALPFEEGSESRRVSNIQTEFFDQVQAALGSDLTQDNLFAYVYGVLHSRDFRDTFALNLKKDAPRIPLVGTRENFDAFVQAGQELLDLHIGFEEVDPYPLTENWRNGADPDANPSLLLVGDRKMRYPKITDPETGKTVDDLTRLIYNDHLTIEDIPRHAHEYMLGSNSAIDWIIDRWYVKTDKASGIVNDVNQWGLERGEPRYIVDLIGRVVTVSLRTTSALSQLPKLRFGDED